MAVDREVCDEALFLGASTQYFPVLLTPFHLTTQPQLKKKLLEAAAVTYIKKEFNAYQFGWKL